MICCKDGMRDLNLHPRRRDIVCLKSNKGVDTWRLTEAVFEIDGIGKSSILFGAWISYFGDVVVLLRLYTVAMSMDYKKPLC